jgi:hypothetical protein
MANREVYRWLGLALAFIVSSILLLEVFFRFVMHSDTRPSSIRTSQGVMFFDTSYARDGWTTIGRLPLERYRWHVNPQGWNSSQDYLTAEERDTPLIAVIGDSYVENLQSDVDLSIAAQLQGLLDDRCLVYGFGREGQSLLQDLLVMEYVDSIYDPDHYVLVLGGDVLTYCIIPDRFISYPYLAPSDTGFAVAPPAPRAASATAEFLLQSALIRYLRLNVGLHLFSLFHVPDDLRHSNSDLSPEQVDSLLPEVADYALGRISGGFGDKGVLVLLNYYESRYDIYGPDVAFSLRAPRVSSDYRLLRQRTMQYPGLDVIDSREAFEIDWQRNGIRFESPDGMHLNGYGNAVIARLLLERLENTGVLDTLLSD